MITAKFLGDYSKVFGCPSSRHFTVHPKDADGMTNSVEYRHGAVWSRFTLIRPACPKKEHITVFLPTAILSLPLIQKRQLSVTGERMCTKY